MKRQKVWNPPKSDTPGNSLNPIESSEIQRWTGMCINQILQIYWTKQVYLALGIQSPSENGFMEPKYNSEVKKEQVQNKQTQLWLGESAFSVEPLYFPSFQNNCRKTPELIT